MGLIRVDSEKCKRDGVCVEVCPLGLLVLDAEGGPKVGPGMSRYCIGCGHCVASCPEGALDNVRSPLADQGVLPQYPVLDPQTASTFLRSRRSIRRYKEEPVPRETMRRLLEIARYAPSGHNSQGISYLVVDDPTALATVRELVVDWMRHVVSSEPDMANKYHMPGIIRAHEMGVDRILRGAPALVVATASVELPPAQVTTYLTLEYVELYATTLGLGTCWAGFAQVCAQQYSPLPEFLRTPEGRTITGMMMVGHPLHTYHRLPERNPLDLSWYEAP